MRYAQGVSTPAEVTPNRRGLKSRELVLDAAERVMAEHGFEAATLARVVEESGVPMSSVYHYYGSKDGMLLAVMERGAERFFADLASSDRRFGRPTQHLATVISATVQALERHPDFLRWLIVFAAQPPAAAHSGVGEVVGRIRELAAATDQLARLTLAAFDGAFVASQSDPAVTLDRLLEPLAPALVAARRALRPRAR